MNTLVLMLFLLRGAQTPTKLPLRALVVSHSVALSWNEDLTQGTVTGYKVYRSNVSGGPYSTLQVLTSNTPTTYTDTSSLTEGSTYYYVVTATGPGGESANSNQASALIPFQAPPPPTSLTTVPK
jgi:fibronectin type 3 domain-containing protein